MESILKLFIWMFSVSAIRYFVIAGIPFFIFYKLLGNKFSRSKIQSRSAGSKDFIRDILHSMQTTAVLVLIAYIVMNKPVVHYTQVYTKINQYPTWWLWLSVFICLIIHDTYFYWMHRLLHHKKLFKYTHVLHHRSTNPSPWTSYSFHIIESFTEGFVLVVIVLVIPVHLFAILMFTIIGFIINVYGHLGYEILPKGFRKTKSFQLFNTSVHHNLHHSKFTGNYGLYFRIWDRLMGTEHPDYVREYDAVQEKRFGAKELTAESLTNDLQVEPQHL